MPRQYRYEIQTCPWPYATGDLVPLGQWETRGQTDDLITAYRVARRWRDRYTPQPGSWNGHVRILMDGRPIHLEVGAGTYEMHEIGD